MHNRSSKSMCRKHKRERCTCEGTLEVTILKGGERCRAYSPRHYSSLRPAFRCSGSRHRVGNISSPRRRGRSHTQVLESEWRLACEGSRTNERMDLHSPGLIQLATKMNILNTLQTATWSAAVKSVRTIHSTQDVIIQPTCGIGTLHVWEPQRVGQGCGYGRH